VTDDDRLKLEYFFNTDPPEKASALAGDGWTAAMTMSTDVVQSWARQMCDLGFKHDCEFDGWGTTPEQ